MEIYIFGIDSPNKNENSATTVYNYEVYLENGTQLDYSKACENSKISISSPITNKDVVKLEEASYFHNLGYDIYNNNNNFYTDVCSHASINGNDITLSDRKKHYSLSDISLCNESCSYANVDFETKRFTCECNISYNFSENYIEENNEEEKKVSFKEYFLSFINYKITVCHKLFLYLKNYYYNIGFYIAVGTFAFCFCCMIIFLKWGLNDLNKIIFNNIPTKQKLKEIIKNKKEQDLKKEISKNNNIPPKRKRYKTFRINKKINIAKIELNNDISKEKNNNNLKLSQKKRKRKKFNSHIIKNNIFINEKNSDNSSLEIKKNKIDINNQQSQIINIKKINIQNINNQNSNIYNNNFNYIRKNSRRKSKKNSSFYIKNTSKEKLINSYIYNRKRYSFINDRFNDLRFTKDENVDPKDFNIIPYTQAIRLDHRNYFQMFFSVLAREIGVVDIFYYKNPYNHLSIILSIYFLELCLDLALNCLLYNSLYNEEVSRIW